MTQPLYHHLSSLSCRLTSLVFKEECIVTACQDGYVCTWARPGLQTRCSDLGTEIATNHYNLTPSSPPANQVRTSAGLDISDD